VNYNEAFYKDSFVGEFLEIGKGVLLKDLVVDIR
jgi:hypothetical protein